MAIYHCSMKSISRGAGQSVVAAAAYRHACKLDNVRTGEVHDYTKKQGLESSAIYLPSGVNAEWAMDRSQLWNAVEEAEKRVNSRLGRDLVLALPSELSEAQRRELAGEMARHLADRYGVVVDVAIHQPSRQGDQRNHHAHMLMSSRRITPQGFGEKARELDDRERGPVEVEHIRAAWADMANRALERAGQHVQIDHRSLAAQGIKRLASLHLGPSASAMERRGIATRIGDRNRSCVQVDNRAREFEAARVLFQKPPGRPQDAAIELETREARETVAQGQESAQDALRASQWGLRREELRQKEKEALGRSTALYERAEQCGGGNAEKEAQKAFAHKKWWKRIFYDKAGTIEDFTKHYQDIAEKCKIDGDKFKAQAEAYAKEGLELALAHPEARNHDDNLVIAQLEAQRKAEQALERQRQEQAKRKAEREALENSGYRGELKRLAKIAKPNVNNETLEKWKKPYLECIKFNNENESVIERVLAVAKYDASPEGQKELKEIKNIIEAPLKSTGCSLSTIWRFSEPAMDKIKISKDREKALEEALSRVEAYMLENRLSLSRGRGR